MTRTHDQLEETAAMAVGGAGAHVAADHLLEGLDWKTAGLRPQGHPFSIFQILNHIIYWQDWGVKWMGGEKPSIPRHASGSWPGVESPTDEHEWLEAVRRFLDGQRSLRESGAGSDLLQKQGQKSRLEMLLTVAFHTSYHAGQVVTLRRILGAWPPPSGGLTW